MAAQRFTGPDGHVYEITRVDSMPEPNRRPQPNPMRIPVRNGAGGVAWLTREQFGLPPNVSGILQSPPAQRRSDSLGELLRNLASPQLPPQSGLLSAPSEWSLMGNPRGSLVPSNVGGLITEEFAHPTRRSSEASLPSGGSGGDDSYGPTSVDPDEPQESDPALVQDNPGNVYSLTTGTVSRVGWQNPNDRKAGLGWRVYVKDSRGYETGYGHMDPRSTPAVGTYVELGDRIGNFANPTNGRSTGPHVHVQVFDPRGRIVDPGMASPLLQGRISTGYNQTDKTHITRHQGVDWIPR